MAWPFRRRPRQLSLPGMPEARRAKPRRRRSGPIQRARLSLVSAPMTRRGFLSRTLGWVTAAIAAVLGTPAVAAVIGPALRKEESGWSPVGRLTEPEPGDVDLRQVGVPVLTDFTSLVEDAYMQAAPRAVPVYVLNRGDGEFTIFDVRCTHLGCPVTWEKDGTFLCPCHNGVFGADGLVLEGPPPRPLDRYEVRVEDGVLFAGKLFQVDEQLRRTTQ